MLVTGPGGPPRRARRGRRRRARSRSISAPRRGELGLREQDRGALLGSQRTFAVWWSSAAPGHGTRIAGVPVTATSATVLAPPRPTSRSAARVHVLDAFVVADDLVQHAVRAVADGRRRGRRSARRPPGARRARRRRRGRSTYVGDRRVERGRAERAAGHGHDEAVGRQPEALPSGVAIPARSTVEDAPPQRGAGDDGPRQRSSRRRRRPTPRPIRAVSALARPGRRS